MGALVEMGEVVNRTAGPLNVRFDGQDLVLKPGLNVIPKVMIDYAIAQNPVMGTEDARNPRKFDSLVGRPGLDNCEPLEQDETQLTRVRIEDVIGDNAKVVVSGRKGKPRATQFDASFTPPGDSAGIGSRE